MPGGPIHEHVQEHIELIARHELEFLARRTSSEKIADRIAGFVGSLKYVLLHVVLFGAWILWNTLEISRLHRFDPFPYPLLDLVLAFEAIVVASFILIRQQRIGRRSEEREQLMLQILLLSEREVTAVLGIERQIAERVGLHELASDEEITQLSEQTPIDEVAQVIQEKVIQENFPRE
jgi:uncharacterized membrane protein